MGELATMLAEAAALDVTVRLQGAEVRVENAAWLPPAMLSEFRHRRGELWAYLGGDAQDQPPIALLDRLGVQAAVAATEAEAHNLIEEIALDAEMLGDGCIGFDIETAALPGLEVRPVVTLTKRGVPRRSQPMLRGGAALDPLRSTIRLVQLYGGGERCAILDTHRITLPGLAAVLAPVLDRCVPVIHNADFELRFLDAAGISLPRYECTMQAAGLLLGVHRRGVDDAASAYLGIDLPKALQVSDWGAPKLSAGQVAYAALDAIIALRLWRKMHPELEAKGRMPAYRLQRRVLAVAARMEARGVLFDTAEHARQVEAWKTELADARHTFHGLTGEAPPAKPREIAALLRQTLAPDALAEWPRTEKSGELATGERHLLRAARDVPALKHLCDVKSREKLISNFGQRLAEKVSPVTGRLHSNFIVAAAKTGRASSRNPNMQQLPAAKAKRFRDCFVAARGHVVVLGDYNAMELRAAAEVSSDAVMRADFANGIDLHRVQAAAVNGIPESEVTPDQRQAAKAINFGTIYGSGGAGLAMSAWASYGIKMTPAEAEQARDTFLGRYPQLASWMRRNHDRCLQRGYIEIGRFGRVIEAAWESSARGGGGLGGGGDNDDRVDGNDDEDAIEWSLRVGMQRRFGLRYTLCCNAPIQGACADVAMLAMALVDRSLTKTGLDGGLVLSVHDELVLEVREDQAGQARALLERSMIVAFNIVFPNAPTRGLVEVRRGTSLGAAKAGRSWEVRPVVTLTKRGVPGRSQPMLRGDGLGGHRLPLLSHRQS